jgi:hypothetical protein
LPEPELRLKKKARPHEKTGRGPLPAGPLQSAAKSDAESAAATKAAAA